MRRLASLALLAALWPATASAPLLTEDQADAAHYESLGRLLEEKGVLAYGRPEIVDGDTLKIRGILVHLEHIDAPELDELCLGGPAGRDLCGGHASRMLAFATEAGVLCVVAGGDHGHHMLGGLCRSAEGDLAEIMVRYGFARATDETYRAAETAAREAQAGYWEPLAALPASWNR